MEVIYLRLPLAERELSPQARTAQDARGVASFHDALVTLTGDTTIPTGIGVQVHYVALDVKVIMIPPYVSH
jgi:hypothetical protein